MVLIFQIVAVILAGVAAYFLWQDNTDGAFVSFVVGSCSWFLSMRFKIKARLAERLAETPEIED